MVQILPKTPTWGLGNFLTIYIATNRKIKTLFLQKIENHKLEWKAAAKTVTRNAGYAPPAKSDKKVRSGQIVMQIFRDCHSDIHYL